MDKNQQSVIWCPINHDVDICEICDRIRNEDIREGTYRDDDMEEIIKKDKIEQFKIFVLNELECLQFNCNKINILEDVYNRSVLKE
jgi:hypothetical protein